MNGKTPGSGSSSPSLLEASASQSQSLLDAVMAETIGMAMHNAVSSQHRSQMLSSAAVTAACARIVRAGENGGALPVVTMPAPQTPPPPQGQTASQIAESNREAEAAITALRRQAESSSKDAATARGDLESLAELATQGSGDQ